MSSEQAADGFTTFCIRRSTKARLESLKPYDSMSWDEFAGELGDVYESRQRAE
jgi:hypothetical protein